MMNNEKYVYIFEGVGSEFNYKKCILNIEQKQLLKKYTDIIKNVLDIDIFTYMYSIPEDRVNDELKNWISIYVYDYIIYKIYINYGLMPKMVVSYSMGLITALASIESISFEDGLRLIMSSYYYGNEKTKEVPLMALIVGLTIEHIEEIIETNQYKDVVMIASENNKYCSLISGVKEQVKIVMDQAVEIGALKVKAINTPKAFHSEFAKIGVEEYKQVLDNIIVRSSKIPILSCYSKKIIHNASDIREELLRNLYSRMYWEKTVEQAISLGNKNFLEVSLSGNLSKLCMEIDPNSRFLTLKNIINYFKKDSDLP